MANSIKKMAMKKEKFNFSFFICLPSFGILNSLLLARYSIFYASLLTLLIGLGLNGCTGKLGFEQLPLHMQMAPLPPGPVCRVAVLPFLNDSDFPLGDAIVSKVFAAQLNNSGNYLVIQEGDILMAYQQLRILPNEPPSLEQLRILADRISAQLLITGIIMEMREDRGEYGSINPMIVMELHIRDGTTGEILWKIFHRRQGADYKKTMHFGTIHSVTALSRQMAEEIINLWFEKGLTQCNVSITS